MYIYQTSQVSLNSDGLEALLGIKYILTRGTKV